jgi:spore germination protein GerM
VRWLVLGLLIASGVAACTDDGGPERAALQTSSTTSPSAATSSSTATTTAGSCVAPTAEPRTPELDTTVKVFLFCNGGVMPVDLRPVDRVVPNDRARLRAAITQLLLGVTPAEAKAGLQSAFSAYTAGTLRDVTVRSGVATLDLTAGFERTNNFSTTNLSGVVLSQIEAAVFQFPEITSIEFEIEGKRWCGWEAGDCDPEPLMKR